MYTNNVLTTGCYLYITCRKRGADRGTTRRAWLTSATIQPLDQHTTL